MNYPKPRQATANTLTYLKPEKRPAVNKTVSYCCSAVIILFTALLLCSCERKSPLDSVPPKKPESENAEKYIAKVFKDGESDVWHDRATRPPLVYGADMSPWERIYDKTFAEQFVSGFEENSPLYLLGVTSSDGRYIEFILGSDDYFIKPKPEESDQINLLCSEGNWWRRGDRVLEVRASENLHYYVYQRWRCTDSYCSASLRAGDKSIVHSYCAKAQ